MILNGLGTWYSSPCGILKRKYSIWNTYPSYPEFDEDIISSHDIIILHGVYKPHHLHEWILAQWDVYHTGTAYVSFLPLYCFAGWVDFRWCLRMPHGRHIWNHIQTPCKDHAKVKEIPVSRTAVAEFDRKFQIFGWGVWKFSPAFHVPKKAKPVYTTQKSLMIVLFNKNCCWETSGSPSTTLDLARVLTTLSEGEESGDMTKSELEDGSCTVMMGDSNPNLHCMEVIWVLCDSNTVYIVQYL